jgi:serine protease Do
MYRTGFIRMVGYRFAITFIGLCLSLGAPIDQIRAVADQNDTVEEQPTAATQAGPRALSRAFRAAARKATPSVVTILSYGQQPVRPRPQSDQATEGTKPKPETKKRAEPDEKKLTGIGSGVIVSADGMIITNNHVIRGAKRVVVQLADESEYTATNVIGDRKSDVATLRIKRDEPFPKCEIGDSDGLEIGDWVLAIGSPFRLEATVSAGIISAKNRKLSRIERGRLIQTDAAINPGNSGGPLIDLDGCVIAINTAIVTRSTGYQGVGFAIPINQAEWIAKELDQHGQVRRSAIGVTMVELKPRIAEKFDLPPWRGVLVYQLIRDSAGEAAGIQQLDVIVEFAGEKVKDPGTLQELIERLPVGSMQVVKVLRGGKELELEIELATIDDPTVGGEEEEEAEEPEESETEELELDEAAKAIEQ